LFATRLEALFERLLDEDNKIEALKAIRTLVAEYQPVAAPGTEEFASVIRSQAQRVIDSDSPSSSEAISLRLPSSLPSSPISSSPAAPSSVPEQPEPKPAHKKEKTPTSPVEAPAVSDASGADTDATVVGGYRSRRGNSGSVPLIIGREYEIKLARYLTFEHLPFKKRQRSAYKNLYDKSTHRNRTLQMVLQSVGESLIVFSDGSVKSPMKEYYRSDVELTLVSNAVSQPDTLQHGMIIEVKYDQDPTWYPLRYSATLTGKTYVVEDKPPTELVDSETYDFDPSNAEFNEAWRFPKYVELQAGDEIDVYFAYDYRQVPDNAKISGWQRVEIMEAGDSDHEFIAQCIPKKPGSRQNSEIDLDLWFRRVRRPRDQDQAEDYDQAEEEEDELEDRVLDERDRVTYMGRNYIVDSVSMGEDDIVYVLKSTDPEFNNVSISQSEWLTRWSPEFEKHTRVLYMGRAAFITEILYSEEKYKIEDSKEDEVIVDESMIDVYTDLTYDEDTIVVFGYKKWRIDSRDEVNMVYRLISEDGTSTQVVTESELEEWCLYANSKQEKIARVGARNASQKKLTIQFEDGSTSNVSFGGPKSNVREQAEVDAYFESKSSTLLDDEEKQIREELAPGTPVVVFGRDGAPPLTKSTRSKGKTIDPSGAAALDYDQYGKIVRSLPGETMLYEIEMDNGRLVTLSPDAFGTDDSTGDDSEAVVEGESSSDDSSDDSDDPMDMTDDEDQDFSEGDVVFLDELETRFEIISRGPDGTFTICSQSDETDVHRNVSASRLTIWSSELEAGDTVVVNGDWNQPVKVIEIDDEIVKLDDGREVLASECIKYYAPLKKGTLVRKAGSKDVYKVIGFKNGEYDLEDVFTGERSVEDIENVDEREEPDFRKGDFVLYGSDIREVKTVLVKKGAYKLSDNRTVQEKDLTDAPDPRFGMQNDDGKWVGDKDQLVHLSGNLQNMFKVKKVLRETREYVVKRTGRLDRSLLVPFSVGTVVRNSSERMMYVVTGFEEMTYTLRDVSSGQVHTASIEEIDVAVVSEDDLDELTENDIDEEDV
tara:strand:+ start:1139 stop:4282 length:3144 start_codon:yes stop_codon:yes gene_type:complete